jgi:phosphohistidine phosphatase
VHEGARRPPFGGCRHGAGPLDTNSRDGHGHEVRTVILLRHGKSSWTDSTLADVDRPLAPRGERAARRIAKYMRRKKIRPELVLCSPSVRTRQTLDAIRDSLGKSCSIELVPELYAASEGELLERLQALPGSVSSVMLIGHNPGLQDLALGLASRGADLGQLREKFPTGALATLVVHRESWAALSRGDAELVDYVVPRQLR